MSTTKQILLTQIENFINEIKDISNNNKEILLFYEQYNLLKSVNSKLIVDAFIQYVYPHKDKIKNKDDTFFLNGGGQEELEKLDKNAIKIRDVLKNLWENKIDDDKKEMVWKYMLVFCLLAEKYMLENI